MTEKINDGGPAFPSPQQETGPSGNGGTVKLNDYQQRGMTLRQYAAINLKLPDSGIDWLDEMIVKAKRDEFAGMALQGMCADGAAISDAPDGWVSGRAYKLADAMIAAREGDGE